jgi:hypothetical protein
MKYNYSFILGHLALDDEIDTLSSNGKKPTYTMQQPQQLQCVKSLKPFIISFM